jgi:hypothetical protein
VPLTCGYLFAGIGQVSNTAGRSHGGSSPSRTRAYVHADSPGTPYGIPGPNDGLVTQLRRVGRVPLQDERFGQSLPEGS